MTAVLIKGGNLETDMNRERTTCEDEGRDWGDVSTPKTDSKTTRS